MAPKRPHPPTDSVTGMAPEPKRSKTKGPLTTREKIAQAEDLEKKAAAAATKKENSKARVLAPPGEVFQPKSSKIKAKSAKAGAPMTTKGKIRAATAKEKQGRVENAVEEKTKGSTSKKAAAGMSLYGAVMTYDKSTLKYVSKDSFSKPKVTERPTERTKMVQAKRSQTQVIYAQIEEAANASATKVVMSRLKITDLPKEIRCQIWELCVVYTDCFIFPTSKTGREQPDLAMTCRSVRSEMLPIYYGRNIFAIDISPSAIRGSSDLLSVRKWCGCLRKMGWSSMIRQWAFSSVSKSEEESFVISIKFVNKEHRPGRRDWDANIEVHRDARCVLPAKHEFGQCFIISTPRWLQNGIIEAISAANGVAIPTDALVNLAKRVQSGAGEFISFKCEKATEDIEIGQRV